MSKVYEIAFQMGGQLTGAFSQTMRGANAALGDLQKNITGLNKQASDIGKLQSMQKSVGSLSREYQQAQSTAQRLGKELANTANPTKKQQQEFERARKSAADLKGELTQKRSELQKLRGSLDATGQSTQQLRARQQQLAESAEKARVAQANLQKTLAKEQANLANRQNLRGQLFDAVALGAAFVAPVKMAADFEQQMATVAAKGGATREELQKLTETARQLGSTTSFSASQAGQGMEYLAMAGFKTNEIVSAMPGMLNLAAAAGSDLGRTADIASDILSGFGLEASDMTRVADVLAKTTTTANTNLEMLGDTMKYVGPVAKAAGMSLEEASAMAGLLANVGIKSSQAGTTMRSMLLRLAAPTGKAAKALNDLGVETRDAEGNARNMVEILGEVAKATEDMGGAERLEYLKEIFGEEPAAGMAELIAQAGADGITKYLDVVQNSAGTAEKIAADMNATVRGSFRQLGSATESLGISVGNIMLPVIQSVTKTLTLAAQSIDKFTQQFPVLSKVLVLGTAALIGLKVAAIAGGYAWTFVYGAGLKVVKVAQTMRVAYMLNTGAIAANTATSKSAVVMSKALAVAQKTAAASTALMTNATRVFGATLLATPIGWIIAGVAALVAAGVLLYKHWDKVSAFFGGFWQGMREGITPVIASFQPLLDMLKPIGDGFAWVWQQVKALGSWFGSLFGRVESSQESLQAASSAGQKFGNAIATVFNAATYPIRMFISAVSSIFDAFNAAKNWLTSFTLADVTGGIVSGVKFAFMNLTPLGWAMQAFNAAKGWLSNFSLSGTASTVVTGVKSAFSLLNPLNWVSKSFNSAKNWLSSFSLTGQASAVISSVKTAFSSLNPLNWFSSAFNSAKNWLSGYSLFRSGSKIMSTLVSGIMSKANEVISSVKGVFSKVRDYLPFSDAKVGPFSELTKSGAAIMETLATGVKQTPALENTIGTKLQGAGDNSMQLLSAAFKAVQSAFNTPMDSMRAVSGMIPPEIKQKITSMIQPQQQGESLLNRALPVNNSTGSTTPITITVEQNIHIGGSADSGNVREQARAGAAEGVENLSVKLEEVLLRARRLSYG